MIRHTTHLLAMVALLALAGLGAAPSAVAHTDLVSSTPADGSTLAEPPRLLSLQFTEAVVGEFAALSLTVDDGQPRRLATPGGREADDTVTADVPADVPVGTWSVGYRVTSADGHPIQGSISFTVAAPAPPGPPPSSAPTMDLDPQPEPHGNAAAPPVGSTAVPVPVPTAAASGSATGSALPAVLVAGSAMVVAMGAFVVRASRRRGVEDPR